MLGRQFSSIPVSAKFDDANDRHFAGIVGIHRRRYLESQVKGLLDFMGQARLAGVSGGGTAFWPQIGRSA
jgi:hypothetical protein